jgi:predicted transcriptional regulator of viral defense system
MRVLDSLNLTIMVKFMSRTMDQLYEVAEPQAGYFTTAQATEAGVSNRALYQRVRRGDIDHVRYGLYRLRRFPAHPFEDVIAACLWAGGDSAASHETALAVHGISDAMPSAIHITVPRPFRGRQDGVVIHHADLPDTDRTRVHAVPVTTIARTLQDVAATSDPALVEQAVAQAITRGTLSRRQLRRLVRDTPSLAPMVVGALAEE